jgi:hypothetical protein
LMTVLDVLNTFSNNIKLGRYTAPVSGEKNPAAVTMRTMHIWRLCEKAEYGGAGAGAGAFSASRSRVAVGGTFSDEIDGGLELASIEDTVELESSLVATAMMSATCDGIDGEKDT